MKAMRTGGTGSVKSSGKGRPMPKMAAVRAGGRGSAKKQEMPVRAGSRRRDQIVKAAIRLFAENGYFITTIEDIAKEADVSKGLIYVHFKDKNDLLFYALRFVLEMYEQDIFALTEESSDPLGVLRTALRKYCRIVSEHPQETLLAYRSTKDLSPRERSRVKLLETKLCRVFRGNLEACIRKGIMVPVNVDVMVYQYVMFSHTWALKNWAFRDKYSFEEYLAEGEKILIDGFLTRRTKK